MFKSETWDRSRVDLPYTPPNGIGVGILNPTNRGLGERILSGNILTFCRIGSEKVLGFNASCRSDVISSRSWRCA
jgi:hypothetical protein